MMVGRVEADHAKQNATDQQHYHPQFEGDENLRRHKTHRQRQQQRHEIAKLKDSVLLEY